MSTRSYIAKQIGEDPYLTIFCHLNGYPDDNGKVLAEHYSTPEQVDRLLALGDLHLLGERMEPDPQYPHNSHCAQPGVTIAYQRDEDLTDCGVRIMSLDELDDWETGGVEYSYIFDLEGKWMYFSTGEAENGLHNLKEDMEADTILFAEPPFDLDGEDDFGESEDDQEEKIELGGMR